ncbi:hypothetical protein [Dysgonomonas reticulitermitis]
MALIIIAIRITIAKNPIELNSVCINKFIISAAKEVYIKEEVGCRPRLSGIAKHPYIHAQTTTLYWRAIRTLYIFSKFGDFDRQGTSYYF